MVSPVTIGIVGGGAVAAYLGIDAWMKKDVPGAAGVSTAGAIVGAVRSVVQPGDVPAVKTGMPIPSLGGADGGYRFIDAPSNRSNDLHAISLMCRDILCNGVGSGDTAAAFASCESQTGNLANACYNCSLFNIHHTSGVGYPSARVGNELIISFRTGAASDVDGFRRCIQHFKGYLERRCPAGLAAIRANNPDAFQVAIASINYSPGYTNSVVGGAIRSSIVRARMNRLKAQGLL